jgi:putative tryptophan/tyrosine transport system substrate-binding protein
MPLIGFLAEVPEVTRLTAEFQRGLAELGYMEGKNLTTEYRFKPESLPQAAADLVRLKVTAIFAAAPAALAAASNVTTSIPVVGVDLDSDPVAKDMSKVFPARAATLRECFLISRN